MWEGLTELLSVSEVVLLDLVRLLFLVSTGTGTIALVTRFTVKNKFVKASNIRITTAIFIIK